MAIMEGIFYLSHSGWMARLFIWNSISPDASLCPILWLLTLEAPWCHYCLAPLKVHAEQDQSSWQSGAPLPSFALCRNIRKFYFQHWGLLDITAATRANISSESKWEGGNRIINCFLLPDHKSFCHFMGLHNGDFFFHDWFAIMSRVNIDSGQINSFWSTTVQKHLTSQKEKAWVRMGWRKWTTQDEKRTLRQTSHTVF